MDFEQQIKAQLEAQLQQEVQKVGAAVLMLQQAVVNGTHGLPGTPIDTGLAQSNWFVEVDGCSGKTSADTSRNNLALAQAAVVATSLGRQHKPKYFSLFNNLPYIRHLEYGLYPNPPKNQTGKTVNGYSTQAPQGMLRLAVKKWEEVVEQVKGKS